MSGEHDAVGREAVDEGSLQVWIDAGHVDYEFLDDPLPVEIHDDIVDGLRAIQTRLQEKHPDLNLQIAYDHVPLG